MAYSFAFPLINSPLSFYLFRSFLHLLALTGLLAHQMLFFRVIDPQFSVWAYLACFLMLFVDSVVLFFFKENDRPSLRLELALFFLDALFLSSFVIIMGPIGLLFVFLCLIFQSFLFFLSGKNFQLCVFFLLLSFFLPLAFLWEGGFSSADSLYIAKFFNTTLICVFFFSWLLSLSLRFFLSKQEIPVVHSDILPDPHIGLSLDLARRLKPGLNSMIKYFPGYLSNKELTMPSADQPFPPGNLRKELEQMRDYILKFIEYAEPETDSLCSRTVDLARLIKDTLKKLAKHPQRPENLILDLELKDSLKIKGSEEHLILCFEHILTNSFEALKSKKKPQINITTNQVLSRWKGKSFIFVEFSDNGHGIASDDIKKLFDPFFSQRFGLRGLGLPYVQKIVRCHGAVLNIKSTTRGTRVRINFPFDPSTPSLPSQKRKYAS